MVQQLGELAFRGDTPPLVEDFPLPLHVLLKIIGNLDNPSLLAMLALFPSLCCKTAHFRDFELNDLHVSVAAHLPVAQRFHMDDVRPMDQIFYPIRIFEFHGDRLNVDSPSIDTLLSFELFDELSFVFRVYPHSWLGKSYYGNLSFGDGTTWMERLPYCTKVMIIESTATSGPIFSIPHLTEHLRKRTADNQNVWVGPGRAVFIDEILNTLKTLIVHKVSHVDHLILPVASDVHMHMYDYPVHGTTVTRPRIEGLLARRVQNFKVFFKGLTPEFGRVDVCGSVFQPDHTRNIPLGFELSDIRAFGGNRLVPFIGDSGIGKHLGLEFVGAFRLVIFQGVHPEIIRSLMFDNIEELFIHHCSIDPTLPSNTFNVELLLHTWSLRYFSYETNIVGDRCPNVMPESLRHLKLQSAAPGFKLGNVLKGKPELQSVVIEYSVFHHTPELPSVHAPVRITPLDFDGSSSLNSLIILGHCDYSLLLPGASSVIPSLRRLSIPLDFYSLTGQDRLHLDVSRFNSIQFLTISLYPPLWRKYCPVNMILLKKLVIDHNRDVPIEIEVTPMFEQVFLNDHQMSPTDRSWMFNGAGRMYNPLPYHSERNNLHLGIPQDIVMGDDLDDPPRGRRRERRGLIVIPDPVADVHRDIVRVDDWDPLEDPFEMEALVVWDT